MSEDGEGTPDWIRCKNCAIQMPRIDELIKAARYFLSDDPGGDAKSRLAMAIKMATDAWQGDVK